MEQYTCFGVPKAFPIYLTKPEQRRVDERQGVRRRRNERNIDGTAVLRVVALERTRANENLDLIGVQRLAAKSLRRGGDKLRDGLRQLIECIDHMTEAA